MWDWIFTLSLADTCLRHKTYDMMNGGVFLLFLACSFLFHSLSNLSVIMMSISQNVICSLNSMHPAVVVPIQTSINSLQVSDTFSVLYSPLPVRGVRWTPPMWHICHTLLMTSHWLVTNLWLTCNCFLLLTCDHFVTDFNWLMTDFFTDLWLIITDLWPTCGWLATDFLPSCDHFVTDF